MSARLRGVLGSTTMVVIPLIVLAGSIAIVSTMGGPQILREKLGSAGLTGSIVVHALLNLTPAGELVPSSVANGALFGVSTGACVNWTGWMLAALFQYGAGRRLGGSAQSVDPLERTPRWLRRWPVDHLAFQVLGRSVPWVGIHGTNLASGWLRIPFPRFLIGSALGLVGPALAMAAAGAGLFRLL